MEVAQLVRVELAHLLVFTVLSCEVLEDLIFHGFPLADFLVFAEASFEGLVHPCEEGLLEFGVEDGTTSEDRPEYFLEEAAEPKGLFLFFAATRTLFGSFFGSLLVFQEIDVEYLHDSLVEGAVCA